MNGRSPFVLAATAQSVLAVYLQAIEWVPMFPWNDLSRGNGQEALDVVLGAVSIALVYGTWRGRRRLIGLAAVAQTLWLAMQMDSWWRPYLIGASEVERRFHARWFGRTVTFLPSIGDHPTPDAAHVVLHVLLVIALGTSIAAWRAGRAPVGSSTQRLGHRSR